ncbi:pyridoxal-phosphate dependent enzyme [Loktanella sp. Alg231-35]|uniref:pyridoxal-phosphate dependent enzyme n=1 Tax=Loktanella sp. Alg231-35 TaxID=1922220 RepID=UPI001F39DDED|nr:pyridoxal-phosphate dependent enzyme [Loktanella sp. Alg231-35]
MTDDFSFAPDFAAARAFFQARDDYQPTPVTTLKGLGGCAVLAKDETNRLGLGAFKALGAPYAVARILDAKWQAQTGEALLPEAQISPQAQAFIAAQTFVCASAGNHGIGVAAGARAAGAKARIHLADTVPESFADRLRAIGASVVRSGAIYEDSVAAATKDADQAGDILLADGTWPGYTVYPKWVMEGYCVIPEELRETFEASGQWPTHVYLQAGVGGLAAAMAHMIRLNWTEQPELIVVEPVSAACLQASHLAGKPSRGEGPESIMGRLDCKDPSIVAWSVLERCDVRYATLTEAEGIGASEQVTSLGIPTTPSGAAGFGALMQADAKLLQDASFRPLVVISERPA